MSVQEGVWVMGMLMAVIALTCAVALGMRGHHGRALLLGAFNAINLGVLVWWAVR